jgi:hypothetical protein
VDTVSDAPARTRRVPTPDRAERIAIAGILLAVVVYLPVVIYRAGVRGFGDVQVFFRAGWAVWTGFPLYQVTDNHGWSYHYPPTFALVMGPFANPLPGHPQPWWALPLPAAVGVWYVLSAIAAFAAVHVWARALERHAGGTFSDRGWWALRLGPLLALLLYLGTRFARGQPTAILILLVCGFLVLAAERKPAGAAWTLSAAIAAKIFPAVFVLIPFLRRDGRMFVHGILACVILLFVLPAIFLGIGPTVDLYRTLWTDRLAGIADSEVAARIQGELSPWSDDMVAIGPMLARTFAAPAPDAPFALPHWAWIAQIVFDAAIVVILAVLGYRRFWWWSGHQPPAAYAILFAGALLLAVLPAMLPVAQPHYWAQAMPLAAVLTVEHWRRSGREEPSRLLAAWSVLAWLAFLATQLSLWTPLRHHGPTTLVMLALVAAGFVAFARLPRTTRP